MSAAVSGTAPTQAQNIQVAHATVPYRKDGSLPMSDLARSFLTVSEPSHMHTGLRLLRRACAPVSNADRCMDSKSLANSFCPSPRALSLYLPLTHLRLSFFAPLSSLHSTPSGTAAVSRGSRHGRGGCVVTATMGGWGVPWPVLHYPQNHGRGTNHPVFYNVLGLGCGVEESSVPAQLLSWPVGSGCSAPPPPQNPLRRGA